MKEITKQFSTIEDLLSEEMNARKRLNALQKQRNRLENACRKALEELNQLKRIAYKMGFSGNIMRDANGNRVMALPESQTEDISPADYHIKLVASSEKDCFEAGMNRWKRSLKRTDLSEEDRVKGALQAYQRQAYAIAIVARIKETRGEDVFDLFS